MKNQGQLALKVPIIQEPSNKMSYSNYCNPDHRHAYRLCCGCGDFLVVLWLAWNISTKASVIQHESYTH